MQKIKSEKKCRFSNSVPLLQDNSDDWNGLRILLTYQSNPSNHRRTIIFYSRHFGTGAIFTFVQVLYQGSNPIQFLKTDHFWTRILFVSFSSLADLGKGNGFQLKKYLVNSRVDCQLAPWFDIREVGSRRDAICVKWEKYWKSKFHLGSASLRAGMNSKNDDVSEKRPYFILRLLDWYLINGKVG